MAAIEAGLVEQLPFEGDIKEQAKQFADKDECGKKVILEELFDFLNIRSVDERLRLWKAAKEKAKSEMDILRFSNGRMVFNDSIHGHIELHPLCVKIINTPEFQRLKFIKQLGFCFFVFPAASHNRFEHCLGVCHLAGKLLRSIKSRQPELNVTERDILCVEIAGLCHDLGHGPFSHSFESSFIAKVRKDRDWHHEQASIDMIDYMLQKDSLKNDFEKFGLGSEKDIAFIKNLILGNKDLEDGRKHQAEKGFLYEIVANQSNNIDVDKWDYFARDSHMLGIKNNFDHNRSIALARVLRVEEENGETTQERYVIGYRDKEAGNLYEMFHTRYELHRRAYQHKTVKIIGHMYTRAGEAFLMANEHFRIDVEQKKKLKMSDAIDDMRAYSQLTDDILLRFLWSVDSNLNDSKKIVEKIFNRDIYKCVWENEWPSDRHTDVKEIEETITSNLDQKYRESIVVKITSLDYGSKSQDPLSKVWFYSKDDVKTGIKGDQVKVFNLIPPTFEKKWIRVYSKEMGTNDLEFVKEACKTWNTSEQQQ